MNIFLSLVLALVVSQGIKFFLYALKNGWNLKIWTADGGFPSTHSALVASLCMAVYFEEGFSVLFFIALTFALLIINDSYKARKEIGDEAKALNMIVVKEKIRFPKLFEGEGHTLGQVFGGIVLGVLITIIVYGL